MPTTLRVSRVLDDGVVGVDVDGDLDVLEREGRERLTLRGRLLQRRILRVGPAEEELEELVLRRDGGRHRLVVALHGREVAGVDLPSTPTASATLAAPRGLRLRAALTGLGLRRSSGFAGSPGRRLRWRRRWRRRSCSGACAAAKCKTGRRREDGGRTLVDRGPAARRQQAPRLGSQRCSVRWRRARRPSFPSDRLSRSRRCSRVGICRP